MEISPAQQILTYDKTFLSETLYRYINRKTSKLKELQNLLGVQ